MIRHCGVLNRVYQQNRQTDHWLLQQEEQMNEDSHYQNATNYGIQEGVRQHMTWLIRQAIAYQKE